MLNNRNFEYNKKIPQGNGYINGQAKCSVSDMKYGLFTMAYNGCGVIALYNLMFCKGKKMSVADIAREITLIRQFCSVFSETECSEFADFLTATELNIRMSESQPIR